mmetsp:Transcript_157556/g.482866  ORF Transcript_157556/g.482866 Transcript_157556/m.482866 type:complete len:288 (-) Transcript_157556:127-990(-)
MLCRTTSSGPCSHLPWSTLTMPALTTLPPDLALRQSWNDFKSSRSPGSGTPSKVSYSQRCRSFWSRRLAKAIIMAKPPLQTPHSTRSPSRPCWFKRTTASWIILTRFCSSSVQGATNCQRSSKSICIKYRRTMSASTSPPTVSDSVRPRSWPKRSRPRPPEPSPGPSLCSRCSDAESQSTAASVRNPRKSLRGRTRPPLPWCPAPEGKSRAEDSSACTSCRAEPARRARPAELLGTAPLPPDAEDPPRSSSSACRRCASSGSNPASSPTSSTKVAIRAISRRPARVS